MNKVNFTRNFKMKLLILILILVKYTYPYIHMDLVENGGYIGKLCIEQNEINDTLIKCGPKISKCMGKGKMEYTDENVPIENNYYPGHIRQCSISCGFQFKYHQVAGTYPLWHVMIYKKLKLINSTYSIIDENYYQAYVENIHLIDVENIRIEFENKYFQYTQIEIGKHHMKFKIYVNDTQFPNYVSKMNFVYGLKTCTKKLNLEHVIVSKPNVACTCK